VQVPIETAGLVGAQQLVALVQTGQATARQVLPTKVIIRQSCGCP
jgi:DNA-binding LacI/PurR family transcriptional regulator